MAGGRAKGTILKSDAAHAAMALLAVGKKPEEIAAEVGVTKTTVYKWMKNPELSAEANALIREKSQYRVARAYQVLEKQLDDPNPWVAQAAARLIIERLGAALQDSESDNVIRIEGMPRLGVPDGTIGKESVDAVEEEAEESGEIEVDATIN